MAIRVDEAHDQAQQLARLRQLMFWLLLASVGSLIALAVLAAIFPSPVPVMLVVVVICFAILMFVAHLVGVLDSSRLRQLHEQALRALERSSARRLLLDITGVPVVDSQVAQGLIVTVQAGRLLGAEVMLVGIRPEVAQAIVGLGLNLGGIRTFSDLQTALQAR